MKLTFLGTGSAFAMKNWQTNMLIEIDDYKLLIDCGTDARFSLAEQGLSHLDINGVYISHLHADHVGGLEWLGFYTYFDPRCKFRPDLYISKSLAGRLWSNTLSGGMESIANKTNELATYFDVDKIDKNGDFSIESINFKPIQVVHIVNDASVEPTFGLMITDEDRKIFITTDTQYCPAQIMNFYEDADLIFQDCETIPFKSGVHAHYSELKELPEHIRKKMWLCHYQDNVIDDSYIWRIRCLDDGFAGFVEKGQTFEY